MSLGYRVTVMLVWPKVGQEPRITSLRGWFPGVYVEMANRLSSSVLVLGLSGEWRKSYDLSSLHACMRASSLRSSR